MGRPHYGAVEKEMTAEEIQALIRQAAQTHGVDPELALRVAHQESRYNPAAVSPKGAQGVMQLMPATAKDLGVTNPLDASQNVSGGVRYLRQLADRYGGDQTKIAAAYNWGMGNVEKKGLDKMPAETRNYVDKVAAQDDPYSQFLPGRAKKEYDPYAQFLPQKQEAQQPEQPAKPANASGWRGGVLGGMARGARDVMDGGAQFLTRGLESASNWANENPVAAQAFNLSGIANPAVADFARSERQKVEKINSGAEQDYKTNWRPDTNGFDWSRLAGSVAATAPIAAVRGATLPQAMAKSAGMGAALATTNKVDNPEDGYWQQKALQMGLGSAVGGIAPAAIAGITKLAGGAANQASKLFSSPTVNQEAAARIADAQKFGIDLTKGQATRDPAQWAFERNIRGVDGAGKPVLDRMTQQNQAFIESLNKIGAGNGAGEYATGQQALSALAAKDAAKQSVVNQAYDVARSSVGAEAQLNGPRLMDTVAKRLEDNYLGDVLPSGIRKAINDFGNGAAPLTVGKAEQLTRAINQQYGSDKVTNLALDHVKQALQGEIAQIGEQSGQQAASAFQAARGQAASRFKWQEAVPAAKAVADGVATPDAFMQKFVMNGSVQDVRNTMMALPLKERAAVQSQVLDTIKSKALSGAQDETGAFSQAGFNRALQSIGREKIQAIVGKAKTDELFSLGRVAENVMRQPANATVSSSNSNVPLMNMLRQTTSLPVLGPNVTKPLMEGMSRYQVSQALAPNAGMYGARSGMFPASSQEEWLRKMLPVSPMLGYGISGGLLGPPQ